MNMFRETICKYCVCFCLQGNSPLQTQETLEVLSVTLDKMLNRQVEKLLPAAIAQGFKV